MCPRESAPILESLNRGEEEEDEAAVSVAEADVDTEQRRDRYCNRVENDLRLVNLGLGFIIPREGNLRIAPSMVVTIVIVFRPAQKKMLAFLLHSLTTALFFFYR